MIQKRSRTRRRLIVLGSVGGSIADLARGLWRSNSGKRWLLPLAVFLCLFGFILILATTVEALAPFEIARRGFLETSTPHHDGTQHDTQP